MDKPVLIEQTSKRLKRLELIVTAMLFLTLFAGFWLLYVAIPLGLAFFVLPECVSSASSPSGSQFGGITDKFIILLLGIFDKNCIFVQNMPCNIDFVVYTIL